MRVTDLYLIVRELRELGILQSTMLEIFKSEDEKSSLYIAQKNTHARLNEILGRYAKYDI